MHWVHAPWVGLSGAVQVSLSRYYTCMSDRCTGRAQPRTTSLHGRYDHIVTGARRGTLVPPLSRRIHLVRKNDASCHVGGRRGARRSSKPVVRVCGTLFPRRRVGQPASHEGARWHAGEHGIRSSGGDIVRSYLVHLTVVPNSFMPAAAGACRRAAPTMITTVVDERALSTVVLERPAVSKCS